MTFSYLYGEALNIELGSDDTAELFTTVRRKAAVNAGQLEFIKRTGCYRKSVSLEMVDDTREYDLADAAILTADDFLRLWDDGVEYVWTDANGNVTYRSGQDFPRRDLSWLNKNSPSWRAAAAVSSPTAWYLRQDDTHVYFGLAEPPAIGSSETATVTLPYVARAADMSTDDAVPFNGLSVLEPWHQAPVHYAAAILNRARKDRDEEQKQLTLFAGYVADYLQEQLPTDGEQIFMAYDYRAAAKRMPISRTQLDPFFY